MGAEAVARGRAATAMPGGEAAFWNPAGLASLDRSRLTILRGDAAQGTGTAVSGLMARPGVGILGLSYLLWDVGDQEFRDADGNPTGVLSVRNHLALVTLAAPLLPRLDVGVNLKVMGFRLGCRGVCQGLATSSTGYALDAGVLWHPSTSLPFRPGAMVAHLGPRFQLRNAEQADPLPTRIRVAAAGDVLRVLGRVARPRPSPVEPCPPLPSGSPG